MRSVQWVHLILSSPPPEFELEGEGCPLEWPAAPRKEPSLVKLHARATYIESIRQRNSNPNTIFISFETLLVSPCTLNLTPTRFILSEATRAGEGGVRIGEEGRKKGSKGRLFHSSWTIGAAHGTRTNGLHTDHSAEVNMHDAAYLSYSS